jgi:GAF domain-containing protein
MADVKSNSAIENNRDPVPNGANSAGPDSTSLRGDYMLLRSLFEVAKDVSASLALDEVLQRAVKSVVSTLQVTHATVFLYNQKRGSGEVVVEYPPMGSVGTVIEREGNPTLLRMESDPSSVIVPDIEMAQDVLGNTQQIARQLGIKSMLLVPIRGGGELIGAITVDVYTERRDFSGREIEGLEAIAGQLSSSIRNAQLFEQINRRAAVNERILLLGRQMMSTQDRNIVFNVAAQAGIDLLHGDGVSVALRDADDKTLYLYLLTDPVTMRPMTAPVVTELPYSESALRFICNSGETLLLGDFSQSHYPDYQVLIHHAPADLWGSGITMHSVVATPLQVAGRIIGTVQVTSKKKDAFSSEDPGILEQIANQLAIALENARLFKQASERVQVERLMNQLGANSAQMDLNTLVLSTMREIGGVLGARVGRVRLQMPTTESPAMKDMQKLRKLLDSRPSIPRSEDRSSGDSTAPGAGSKATQEAS